MQTIRVAVLGFSLCSGLCSWNTNSRSLAARSLTVVEEHHRAVAEARVRLRRENLPLLFHDFFSQRESVVVDPAAPGLKSRGDKVGLVWSFVVENLTAVPLRVTALAEADTRACPVIMLRGPDFVRPQGYAVLSARASSQCAYFASSVWVGATKIGLSGIRRMAGPTYRGLAPLPLPAQQLVWDACPSGLEDYGKQTAQRGSHSCGPRAGLSFASARRFCSNRGLRLPTRRELYFWFDARRKFASGPLLLARAGAFPMIWSDSSFQGGSKAVWVLDVHRAEMVARLRRSSALALCVRSRGSGLSASAGRVKRPARASVPYDMGGAN